MSYVNRGALGRYIFLSKIGPAARNVSFNISKRFKLGAAETAAHPT